MSRAGAANGAFERVEAAVAYVRRRWREMPVAALVLGSGLSGVAAATSGAVAVPYGEIPHWPVSTVPGHAGRLVLGRLRGRPVAVLAGRVHAYEGHPPEALAFAVRVVGRLGVPRVVLTNAAGAVNPGFAPGEVMVIEDHLNLLGVNPLVGGHDERFGPRFPDMSEVYSPRLRAIVAAAAAVRGVSLRRGVYAALPGPSYETPAEIRYLRAVGADAVGMSTVPEAIAARHMGLEVLGLSCLTNVAAGMRPEPVGHDEVLATAGRMRQTLTALLEDVVERL